MKEALLLEIIDQILYEPLFTQLRSREGIGYIVRSSVRKSNGCHGLLIFVQGDKQPSFLSERIFNALMKIEVRIIFLLFIAKILFFCRAYNTIVDWLLYLFKALARIV